MRKTALKTFVSPDDGGFVRAARCPTRITRIRRLAARLVACAPLALLAVNGAVAAPATPYARMASADAYLMDRTQEIALARSAAPQAISKDATVLVLTRTGYEAAVTGRNGFVCWVARSFSGATDWPERWNPKIRAAGCDNPQAARTVTEIAKLRTAMTLTGHSDAEVAERIKAALRASKIPPLASGAMCYMMSKSSYLSDDGGHNMAHVMFYVPSKDGTDWGANVNGSPLFGGNYWFYSPEHQAEASAFPPLSVLLVGVSTWSDGTPAAMPSM